ncbi:non-ribosomal peptide synthetase [Chroococcus sp. FPU101]|uniref:non-ribosomal peptide synthetase n=1 Tax=Chroococcus sp. FPU101 TaxID=1974212 RepID=UPI001A8E5EBA|nr:non-ribosomal peptide synthetase [Chroococcus sp. FPU101]GFE67456.1 non-ribosomal peptide synthetase [Chroococcus sp. FPU101]
MENIEDIYELSPLQQGMLFHTLYSPESGVYFEQRSCLLQGNLNVTIFQKAWQLVIERHAVLRTAFYWEEVEKPLQVVYKTVELPWIVEDWNSEDEERLETFLLADRKRGFNLNEAPLMRCALIRVGKNAYRFVWSHHHLLMDGWCNGILLKEVLAFYEALLQNKTLTLIPPRPYRDYILWLQEQNLEKAETYWRQSLQSFTEPTKLSIKLSKKQESYQEEKLNLSSSLTTKLQAFAQENRLTLNTLIQGAWAFILSRYSNENDILFGATVSGRPPTLTEVDSIVGLFINTLPVRIKINSDDLIFWLQQLQVQQIEREQYSYSSLIDIQGWSEVPRGIPLFESLLVFENYPISLETILQEWNGILKISDTKGFEQTNYPLTLSVIPSSELSLHISYDVGCFDADTIKQILEHLELILSTIATNPQSIQDLPLLTPSDEQKLFIECNNTKQVYLLDKCIHQLFEEQVEKTPDAIAVIFEDQTLTYHQLNQRANQLANYLKSCGVKPDELIGIFLERSLEMIIGLLGILKSGCAYIPLDPNYPKERLDYIIQETQIKVLLTQQDLIQNTYQIPVIFLDQAWEHLSSHSDSNLDLSLHFNNLAYIIYTSGSTGKPKGVMIEHRSLVSFTQWAIKHYQLTSNDRILQFATISFDVAAEEIYPCLCSGGTLVLRTDEMLSDVTKFIQKCQELEITVLNIPTAYWYQLNTVSEFPSSLRLVIIGGEKVISSHNNLNSSTQLINAYGLTETTITSTTYTIENNLSEIPIGRAIDNVQTYIVDRNLQPVPIGVAGELLIGGLHLARGYFNRPDLTADKFIPNPFTQFNGERLYKTGDQARYLSDGDIEYLGRLDNQVKIRGFRIELGEIEAILNQHPDIQEAIVLTYDQQLAAYIVTHQALTVSDLRHFLREQLPEYMIPAYFVFLESFPLTVNGKINHRQLPTPVPSRTDEVTYLVPRTPVEEIITGIWGSVLGIETVGVEDNFFELGGHSLLATQVISRLRDAFNTDISLKDLFNSPTVVGLAQKIELSQQKESITPILQINREQDLPLSFAQARLWFLAQLEPDNPFYNIAIPIRIQGKLQVDVLEQSFNKILQRHEILRTTFETRDGKPIQVIWPKVRFNLDIFESQEPIKELALKEAQHPFILDQSPLLRVKILRVSETEHILFLTLHHIIADGWSLGILVRELAALYQGKALEPLSLQYADFASWQREYLQGQKLATLLNYWKEQLHDAPSLLELPSDRPRSAIQSFRGARYKFKLSGQLTDALKTLSQKSGSTLFMVLLATFSTLLHRYTGSSDLVIGSPIANRNRSELEALIGFFVNTLPLRINSAGNPTFEELLQRVRQVSLDAYNHQDLPFERILEGLSAPRPSGMPPTGDGIGDSPAGAACTPRDYLQLERSLSYSPLFQVMFVLQNTPMEKIEVAGLTWTPLELENGTAKFDLTITLEETEQGLDGVFEYNTDLFEAATIHRMAGCFRTLLSAVVESPELPISELPLLSKAEQKQLLLSCNETKTDYPKDLCIHQVFERQATKTPDAVAVVYEEQQLTYRELNQRARQFASILQQQRVTTETLVGLCVDHSFDLIVGMLAILMSGGVYIPIDATYPQERINFIVEDTGLTLVLTQHQYITQFSNIKCLCLDSVGVWLPNPEPQKNVLINSTPQPDNLAYIMYTSGSTGIPKGVCIPHQGIVRLVKENNYIHFGSDEVFLQAAPTSFDAATFEIWGALLNGAKLVLLPYHQPSLAQLGEAIIQYQITTLWLTAGLFQLMIDEQLDSLASVRQLLAGGDVLSRVHVQKFLHRYPNSRLINGYGPTEGTTFTCTADLKLTDDALPIGHPISNTQVYILDSYLQPVPIGVAGELYIGGDGLARGYLNRFDLTAEKFIPNPFIKGQRLYQTGDRVRYLPNGNIEYLDRLDRQVKIRGFRIELGEIEAILNQHPKVKESVVIVQERLIAYVVPSLELTSSELRSFVSERLPDYMIPAFFVLLDSLPLTSNGKIDRIALPSPEITVSDDVPHTVIESKLAKIWSNLLNLETVGIHDNFFELGGDSILAIQIVARANQAGLQITPKQIFQYQTIAELATIAGTSKIISEQGLVTGLVPLTPIQHWFFEQNLSNPHHFNQAVLLEVKSELNLSYLQQALEHLFLHHDALRLRFEYQSGEWQQVISNEIPRLNLNVSNLNEIETSANQLQQSLDLSSDLVRVACFGSRLLFVVHHLVIDGISWRILLEDLQTAYQQLERGETIQLPSKTTSFKQWSESLQEYTDSETEREYWRTLLSNPVYPLPVDERGENTIASSDTVTVILDTEQTQALLTEVPQAYNTQINDILLTALVLAFKKWTGNSTLLLDLESHGRETIFTEIDVSRTVGWFTSIFPVYLNLEDETLEKAIKTIKEQLRRIPNQGVGYGILNYIKSSDSIRSSKAEVSFNYLGQFDQMLSASPYFNLAQESTGLSSALQNQRRYLLEINGMIRDKQLYLNWTYSKRIHERTTIENLAQYFLTSLQDLIEYCQLDAGGYTPSDFTLAQLDSEQLDAVMMMVEFEGES